MMRNDTRTYHPIGAYSIHVNLCNKSDGWGYIWIFGSTFHIQTVYPVLISGLEKTQTKNLKKKCKSV